MIEYMRPLFAYIVEFALDIIAPPDPVVREIERTDAADFLARVAPSRLERAADGQADRWVDDIRAIFSYKDPLAKAAILELKSYGNKKMAHVLAHALHAHLPAELAHPLVIPIPMTKKSLRERGWNQCELIGRALHKIGVADADAAETSFEMRADILQKVRQTGDQVGKGRAERFENLRDCFAVRNPDQIRGRNVVIFDDILTTGATLGEAAKACKNAGAARVFCIALAH